MSFGSLDLPKTYKITKKKDFQLLREQSSKSFVHPLICYYKKRQILNANSRIAFSVSRKVGKAHVRNRHKRILRELFRLDPQLRNLGNDLLFVIIKGPQTEQQIIQAFRKISRELVRLR